MNGGLLIQDVSGHAIFGTHQIWDFKANIAYDITSTHHQMQYPYNLDSSDYTLMACSMQQRSNNYDGDKINPDNMGYEPEIVLYHKKNMPKCLAIQGHPEYMRHESPIIGRLNEMINDLLNQ